MGGAVGFFTILLRGYVLPVIILVAAAAVFIKLNRMQSVYQKSLVRKVNKIKERQNEYINEKDKSKLSKLEKKHAKAVKSLERRIKRIMFFNRNIIITNNDLVDNANLALPNQTEFTFNSKLDEMIAAFNEKHKRHKTINAEKKGNEITVEDTKVEVVEERTETLSRNLTKEEEKDFEEVHQITLDEVIIRMEQKAAEETENKLPNDIYKDQSDDDNDTLEH